MKVLIAYRDNLVNDNMFVKTLTEGLRSLNITVDLSLESLWDKDLAETYDIVHIQWPEELFQWKNITDLDLVRLTDKLNSLRCKGVKIVYTRHNLVPHYRNENLYKLYNIIETYSSAIVHMGNFSLKEYLDKNPSNDIIQSIIPHHIYEYVYNENFSQEEARRKLKIPLNKFVILSFGKFRFKDEIIMVLKAFYKLPLKNKFLLAPRIFPFEKKSNKKNLLKRLLSLLGYQVIYPYSRYFNSRLGLENELVTDEDLPLYFIAADVVLVQRKNILNSGNIPTAFLFKKVVVGPECGNITEILKATLNPLFNPKDNESMINALIEACLLSKKSHGLNNYKFALEHWGIQVISREYLRLYEILTTNRL